jgi:hypothetical protein
MADSSKILWVGRKPLAEVAAFLIEHQRTGNVKPGFTPVYVMHESYCRFPQGIDLCICPGGPEVQIGGDPPQHADN